MSAPTAGRWRKRPIAIDAIEFDGTPGAVAAVTDFAGGPYALGVQWNAITLTGGRIVTLEGPMDFAPGWWIIRGVKGELYPCRGDVFAASYEPAGDES